MTAIPVLTAEAIATLRRDHERLRYQVNRQWHLLHALRVPVSNPKPLATICLTAGIETTDEAATGTIDAQYGPGPDAPETTVTVWNLPHPDGDYTFEGAADTRCLATWLRPGHYRIENMPCPT